MNRFLAVFAVFLISACATVSEPVEGLITQVDLPGWEVGYQKDFGSGIGYIREFVPPGESIDSWSKLVSIEFLEGESRSPSELIQAFYNEKAELCPGTEFQILGTADYSVTYLFSFPECNGHKMQSEVSRIYAGNDGLHKLSYAEKTAALSESTINEWVSEFDRAYIVKGSEKTPIR